MAKAHGECAGQLALVLHAHLPFVRHPEHERFPEEDRLYEAIGECYLPLLDVFFGLVNHDVPFQLTLVLTPTLLAMLSDTLLIQRMVHHFDRLLELAEREVLRTRTDERFHPLALFYRDHFQRYRSLFQNTFQCDSGASVSNACGHRSSGGPAPWRQRRPQSGPVLPPRIGPRGLRSCAPRPTSPRGRGPGRSRQPRRPGRKNSR